MLHLTNGKENVMLFFTVAIAEGQKHAASRCVPLDELIVKVGEGDTDAFAKLYHMTDSSVFAFALSILKNEHDAQDVMQETYIRIRESAARFSGEGHAMTWIMTITKNLALMHLRSAGKSVSSDAEIMEETLSDTSGNIQQNSENRLLLDAALNILTDTQRQIVMLHAVSGLKHREIADLLDMPLATVLSHYSRSLSKLKKFLEER